LATNDDVLGTYQLIESKRSTVSNPFIFLSLAYPGARTARLAAD